jgi:hypothetical protein
MMVVGVLLFASTYLNAADVDDEMADSLRVKRALNYIQPLGYDSITTETLAVPDLVASGWQWALPPWVEDSVTISKTTLLRTRLSEYGAPSVMVQTFTEVHSGEFLFAVTSQDSLSGESMTGLSLRDLSLGLSTHTRVELLDGIRPNCSASIAQIIAPPFMMGGLLRDEMCTYQLFPAVVKGDTSCVWIVSISGPSSPRWKSDFGIHVVDVRTDLLVVEWDGCPSHPERIIEMYDFKDVLRFPTESPD